MADAVSQKEKGKQQNIVKKMIKKEKKSPQKKIIKKIPPKKVIAKNISSKNLLHSMSIGGFTFQTETARTRQEHEKGLSGRNSLGNDQGMLFMFPKEGVYSFWMKDMKFPIDIIWIGKDATIKGYVAHVKPDSYPALYQPGERILYALEVPDGFIEKHSIGVGEKVKLPKSVVSSK